MATGPSRKRGRPKKVELPEEFRAPPKPKKTGIPNITREQILAMREKAPKDTGMASKWDDNLEYVFACFQSLLEDWENLHREHKWTTLEREEQEWYEHWQLARTVLEDRRNSSGWAGGEKLKPMGEYPQPVPTTSGRL